MKRQELRELMNCCQPDLRDLTDEQSRAVAEALAQDPSLRQQWQALQAWDQAIGRAFQDVPVPDGLAARLMAAAAAADEVPLPAPETVRPDQSRATDLATDRATDRATGSRRRWLLWPAGLAAGLLATSAVMVLALWLAGWGDNLTAARVAESARTWIGRVDAEAWQSTDPPAGEFPLDPSVRLAVVGWQPCSAVTSWPGVVYRADLPPNQTAAFLFVLQTRQGRQLPTIPPLLPDSTTGNVCIGVWKNNGCLYVLVVPGTTNDYQRALHSQAVA